MKSRKTFRPWIGFDLDGTLAEALPHWQGPGAIGKPRPHMIQKAKEHIKNGDVIKIFTARISYVGCHCDVLGTTQTRNHIVEPIKRWVEEHIGCANVQVTCIKDGGMKIMYDDRAADIEPKTITSGICALEKSSQKCIQERFTRMAGVTNQKPGKSRAQFLNVVRAMVEVQRRKSAQYGDYVEDRKQEGCKEFQIIAQFMDMKRKWTRYQNLANGMLKNPESFSWDAMLETMMDLSIYGAMNIDLLLSLEAEDESTIIKLR